jgi:predicted DCC family thiol-disulfide oxidoreductase YuxK
MAARAQPVLVYDGDCAFCTSSAQLLEKTGPGAAMVPWQQADLDSLGLTEEAASAAVRWVEIDGTVRSGHEAVAAALISAGGAWALAGRTLFLPAISPMADGAYHFIAANRGRLPGGTPACATGPQEIRRRTSRSIFARRLALSLPLVLAAGRICSPSRKRSRTRGSM